MYISLCASSNRNKGTNICGNCPARQRDQVSHVMLVDPLEFLKFDRALKDYSRYIAIRGYDLSAGGRGKENHHAAQLPWQQPKHAVVYRNMSHPTAMLWLVLGLSIRMHLDVVAAGHAMSVTYRYPMAKLSPSAGSVRGLSEPKTQGRKSSQHKSRTATVLCNMM
jgi:hypothetical protein